MFTTILVPLDGSSQAEVVLPLAARIAGHTGATLLLLHVVSFAASSWAATMTFNPLLAEAVVEADLEEATTYLKEAAASPAVRDLPVKTILRHGHAASTIVEVATSSRSDLIILCRRGASGLTRWAMGSTAANVARHAAIPVLVVPEDFLLLGDTSADLASPLRILIPLDGSTLAQAALEPGAVLLTALAAPGQTVTLHLAQVVTPLRPKAREHSRESTAVLQAKHAMRHTAAQLRQGSLAPSLALHQIPVTWTVLLDVDVASALLRVVEPGDDAEGVDVFGGCQFIAISTHGRGGLSRWIMGSITERVLSATRHPILIVHPTGMQGPDAREKSENRAR